MTDLPGNLSRVRALRLLFGLRWRKLAVTLFLIAYAVMNWVIRLHATLRGLFIVGGVLLVVTAFSAINVVIGRRRLGPVQIMSDRQPALVALVRDTARQIDVPEPDRISIVGHAHVVAVVSRRRELRIGLPLLLALSDRELRAVTARELSIMSRGRLALRLYRPWAAATERVELLEDSSKARRRDVRMIAALDTFGTEMSTVADQAAAAAIGINEAMVATARANYLGLDFEIFSTLWGAALGPRIDGRLFKIEDLHDGWVRRCRAGAGFPELNIGEYEDWSLHPSFSSNAGNVVSQEVTTVPSTRAIAMGTLTTTELRRLATALMPAVQRRQRRQWRTFATAPAELWRRDVETDAGDVVAGIAEVLGREPVDEVEAAGVIQSHTIDVCIATGTADEPDEVDTTRARASLWLDLLEGTLVKRGWLRVDPVVPGILRDPAEQVLDGRDLTHRAVMDEGAYAELQALLATADPSVAPTTTAPRGLLDHPHKTVAQYATGPVPPAMQGDLLG